MRNFIERHLTFGTSDVCALPLSLEIERNGDGSVNAVVIGFLIWFAAFGQNE